MKKNKLPFQIGKHYEKWEFDLDYLEEEKIQGFDSYIYIWKKSFLNLVPHLIELLFELDILQVVIMNFEFESLEQLSNFRTILDQTFGERTQLKNEYLDAEIYKLLGGLELWLVYIPLGYRFEISYGKEKYLKKIYI